MIRVSQLKLPINHTPEDIKQAAAKLLKIKTDKIKDLTIIKKSLDARKNDLKYIYTVELNLHPDKNENEKSLQQKFKSENITITEQTKYSFSSSGTNSLKVRPVVVGTGPAGLFAALMLARYGFQPLVIERGFEVDKRVTAVERFWKTNELNPECNVQFGEGGAGTFSDGKLNTMVKDANMCYPLVMETFVSFGAPSEIMYLNKPHIGTDKLRDVVKNMRNEIIRLGGEVRFGTKLTDITVVDNKLEAIELNNQEKLKCNVLIAAIGHSARDSFSLFKKRGLILEPKAFALGLRIEHKQSVISRAQYGDEFMKLPAADYKLTHQTKAGRGVYTFCMCPGGFVVNASSEQGHLAVNGMSNYARDEANANSAIVVTVQPEDFGSTDPLAGIEFQRLWERKAYEAGKGSVPVQLFGDLLSNKVSTTVGGIIPNIKGSYRLADLNSILPGDIAEALKEGVLAFDKKIKGFADEEAVLSGVESRTSSPVRIKRGDSFESNIAGLYPCGEGAGYAGGITSAAIDGIKVFEAIASLYKPDYE